MARAQRSAPSPTLPRKRGEGRVGVALSSIGGEVVTTLWRRTHPLRMIVLAFGSAIALTLASVVTDQPEPIGLDTSVIILVLVGIWFFLLGGPGGGTTTNPDTDITVNLPSVEIPAPS